MFQGISEQPDWADPDPAWCYVCNHDTAFCECKCYVCDELLEECQCTCAQCDTKVVGGGLCPEHKANWDEALQGPEPDSSHEVGECEKCGIAFCRAFILEPHSGIANEKGVVRTAYLTDRTTCLKCDS